jgi:hypothetical protein
VSVRSSLRLAVSSLLVAGALASPASAHHGEHDAALDYGKLPLAFEANQGQSDLSVDFLARGSGYNVALSRGDAVLRLSDGLTVGIALVDANPQPAVTPLEPLAGTVNYLRGSDPSAWQTNVPTFGRVAYDEVYPGIDIAYFGSQGRVEYDFIVAPGASVDQIALRFDGAEALEVDADGSLVVRTAGGDLRQARPVVYQDAQIIEGSFVVNADRLTFAIGDYDASKPLVIDPALEYSTYLGGKGDENYWFGVANAGIAVDSSGSAYVVGSTTSPDFPAKFGGFKDGGMDIFVAKLNPSGSGLVYATYLGGTGFDMGNSIAVDRAGNAYITGLTSSIDFPLANPLQAVHGGGAEDAFVLKLNATGSGLVYSTYLGGNGVGWGEAGFGIAVDAAQNAYVTGASNSPNFPLVNAAQPANAGLTDAFLTRLNAAGTGIVYSTFLGGLDEESGHAVAVDRAGNAYITGYTRSNGLAFPAGVLQTVRNGPTDAIVAKYGPAGNRIYTTYVGGGGDELSFGLAVDATGNAYIAGRTGGTFYITPGWFNQTCLDPAAFVAKLNPSATGLVYAGCLDAPGKDAGLGLALDRAENVYVTGFTMSPKFPVVDAFQPALRGTHDAFISKINASGTVLVYSSFLGGTGTESGLGVAVDFGGHAYVTGMTTSSADFPLKAPMQPVFGGGGYDAFVVKIDCGP